MALGAEAEITIRHQDRDRAQRALDACVQEVRRLEAVFSLYRPDSALVRLNGEGFLDRPPADLVDVMGRAAEVSRISDGAFDVTVQPLWGVHVRASRDIRGFARDIERCRALIDWRKLVLDPECIQFREPGMAATLNGIAQGYATDRVVAVLRDWGFEHVLAHLGEFRAQGGRGPFQPWRIGIAWPDGLAPSPAASPSDLAAVLELRDLAVATSSPSAAPFDGEGLRHHLFDPRTGLSVRGWASVSVTAATATRADALSTAIAVAPMAAAEAILRAGGGVQAILIDGQGRVRRLRA
jgi:thiamine biosynthesis lipoprotein